MKRMSRWLAILMAAIMMLGCFQMASAEGAQLEEVDLIYWVGANPDQKDEAMVMAELQKIAKEALNVNIDVQIIATSEFKEKFNKAMAAQERIDLTWTGYIQPIQELVNLGALMPLDDLLAEYGQDLIASIDERLLDAHRQTDGLLYQFPAWQGMVGERTYLIVSKEDVDATVGEEWVNELQDLLYASWDKEDVEAKLAVHAHVEEYLAALKEAGRIGLGYGGYTNLSTNWTEWSIFKLANYGYIERYDETFTVKPLVDREWNRAYAQLIAEWFDKGYTRTDIASFEINSENPKEGFFIEGSGHPVMYGHNGFTEDISKELAGLLIDVYSVHTNPYCATTLGQATGTSIPFTAKEPERAMMFMNWLVKGDELATKWYNTFSYGIEGTHYAWNEDKTMIDVFGGDTQAGADWDYGQRPWMLGTMLNAYSSPSYPAEYYDELIALQEEAYTSPLLGFTFDPTDVEIEYNLLAAVNEEYKNVFGKGYLGAAGWEAKYDEYRDKLYANGLEAVIEAIQEQVTAFVTNGNRTW